MKIKKTFKVEDLVFAKVKGYPPWPAKVTSINGKKYTVQFYGTREIGNLGPENLHYYIKNKNKYGKPKRKDFIEAVTEIEAEIDELGTDGKTSTSDPDSTMIPNNDLKQLSNKRKRSISSNEGTPKVEKVLRESSQIFTTITITQDKNEIEVRKVDEVKKVIEDKKADKVIKKEVDIPEPEVIEPDVKELKDVKVKKEGKVEKDVVVKAEKPVEEKIENFVDHNGQEEKGFESEDKSLKPADGNKLNKSPNLPKQWSKKMPTPKKQRKSIDNNKVSETLQNAKEDETTNLDDVQLISDEYLKVYILYAEKVQKYEDLFKGMKPDPASFEDEVDKRCKVLPVKVASQKYEGIKCKLPDIKIYSSEFERAKAEAKIATETIEFANALGKGKEVKVDDERIIHNLAVSEKNLPELLNLNVLKYKTDKLDWLRREHELFDTITVIKAALSIDKAHSDVALQGLKNIVDMNIDSLMLKKHPMFFEVIHRLKQYVGNLTKWNMTAAEMARFATNAKEIRDLAYKVFNKFEDLFEYSGRDNFMDEFTKECKQLECNVQELSETEFFALHVEPNTRTYFLDQVFDNLYKW